MWSGSHVFLFVLSENLRSEKQPKVAPAVRARMRVTLRIKVLFRLRFVYYYHDLPTLSCCETHLVCLLSTNSPASSVLKLTVFFAGVASSVKQFTCPDCHKSYKYKSNLARHVRYECGVDPQFVCKFCSKAYTQKSNLKSHLLYAHGWE